VIGDKTIRTPIGTAPVLPVMLMSLGAYLCWFGVHYWRSDTRYPTDPLKAVLTGQPLPVADRSQDQAALKGVVTSAQAAATASASAGGGISNQPTGPAAGSQAGGGGQAIASAALKYIGASYVYGGQADRVGNWDCSSFVSFVLGHDLGYKLPGGKWGDPGFPPHAHGPATGNYMMFGKPVTPAQVQNGDLVVSSEHMGIVVAANTYMSAKTPTLGTGMGDYTKNFPGGSPVFRRVT
jgi:Cell wall-associated hydrolases (invasion-associated proteins)